MLGMTDEIDQRERAISKLYGFLLVNKDNLKVKHYSSFNYQQKCQYRLAKKRSSDTRSRANCCGRKGWISIYFTFSI